MTTVLIVEDEVTQRSLVSALIHKRFGYDVLEAEDGEQALYCIQRNKIDLVIMDVSMPKKDGLQTLKEISETYPNLPVIMLTGSSQMEHAVKAMKMGASDFLPKPAEPERLSVAIFHALKMGSMAKELNRYKRKESGELHFEDMIGHDGGLKPLMKVARKAAESSLPILITGETGTGKEVLARVIHGESARAGSPFIAINCAAIPDQLVESTLFGHEKGAFTGAISKALGKFREAEGGTIFLDEVGELPLEAQAKLLRVLQQKEVEPVGAGKTVSVNVRVISATNRDLQKEVKSASFREDLFFRLNVLPMHLPELSKRQQDIPKLVAYFMDRTAALNDLPLKEISTQALCMLSAHHFNGNVRELENTIQRMMVMSEEQVICVEDVNAVLALQTSTGKTDDSEQASSMLHLLQTNGKLMTIKEIERAAIRFALQHHEGNVTQTAKSLGMAKPTLYRRLSELKLRSE